MNKINKIFTVSALVLALSACNEGGDSLFNIPGGVSISGEAFTGQTLTAVVLDPNGFNESNVSYQWFSNDTEISGATSSSYILTDDELSTTITVTANYTDNDSNDEAVRSAQTAEVETPAVNTAGIVAITGSAITGQELTAAITDENGIPLESVTYAWLADTDVIGTGLSTVTLTDAEIGKAVTVTVTYTDNDDFSESVTSDETAAVTPIPPTPAEFSGNLPVTTTSSETAAITGTITVTDINDGEDTIQDLTNIATTYGTFSITTAGAWTYTVDPTNSSVSALTSADANLVDTITVTSFDGTTADLLISITGAGLVPNNILTIADAGQARIVVTDTDAQLTDAGIAENNGRLTVESGSFSFRFNAQDVGDTSFVALFGGRSNTPRPILELRFDEGKLSIDDNITGNLIELTQTYVEDTWNDVEITWDTALATDAILPIVTLSINGTNMVKIIIAANADAAVDTDRFQLDDIKMVNSDANATTTVIFDADLEDLTAGDAAPTPTTEVPTGDSVFNGATVNAVVETVLELPRIQ